MCWNDGQQAQNCTQCVIQELELENQEVIRSAAQMHLHDGA